MEVDQALENKFKTAQIRCHNYDIFNIPSNQIFSHTITVITSMHKKF